MTATVLPYDIWECISVYIPEPQLLTLYGLNRALHCAAMNKKYRTIEFDDFDDEKMELLERLRDPIVARRVKRLHVDTHAVFTSHHRRGSTIYSSDEIIRAMTGALEGMHNIQEFHVNWRDHIFSHDLIPFLSAAWKRLAPTICVLHLTAPAGRFGTLLGLAAHHSFPSLHAIELLLDRWATPMGMILPIPCLDSSTTPASICRAWLSGHTLISTALSLHTLSSVEWGVAATDVDDDVERLDRTIAALCSSEDLTAMRTLGLYITSSSFVTALGAIDRNIYTLTSLHLDGLAFDMDQLGELSGTFKQAGVLEELKLTVDVLALDVVEVLSRLPSSLLSLNLAFHHMLSVEQWSTEDRPAINVHRLQHLDVHGVSMYLSLDGAKVLLKAFVHYMAISSSLESLDLVVHTLNPQLIDALASSVPRLYSIWLRIIELNGEDDNDERWMTRLGSFEVDMKSRTFPTWSLEEARITSTYFDGTTVRRTEHSEIVGVLAKSIPSMMSL
ncbi:hypothetical protein BDZ89DRAFT_1137883 [Hymenopellis radicata]|nr:hypothetical protein BDZ89DRAFT_1137883 [Hymenopellis radicata]